MWRALRVVRGELVAYLDSDTRDFSPHFALGHARPADLRAGAALREGLLPAALSSAPTARLPRRTGAASPSSPRGRSCPPSTPSWPGSSSRWPVRWRRAARCSSGSRSRPATRWRPRCCFHARDALGGTEGMAQVDLDVRLNQHQPLRQLAPDGVRGAPRDPRAAARRGPPAATTTPRRSRPPTAGSCRSRSWSARRTPRSARTRSGHQVRLHRSRRHAARPRRVAVPHR